MKGLFDLLAFGLAFLCLGVAFTVQLLGAVASQHGPDETNEGCFCTVFALIIMAIGIGFLMLTGAA